jgi:uncharacterized protein (DUF433 family)
MNMPEPHPPETIPAKATSPYIHVVDGVMRIVGTRVSLDSIVIAYQQGSSPEDIQHDFPGLSIEQIRQAIDYFLANRTEVERYLHSHEVACAYWKGWWDAQPSPARDRLRALKKAQLERAGEHA